MDACGSGRMSGKAEEGPQEARLAAEYERGAGLVDRGKAGDAVKKGCGRLEEGKTGEKVM